MFGFYQESDILDQTISKESVVLETEENAVFGDGHQVFGFEIGKLALHAVAQQIPVNPNQILAFLLRKWLFRQVLILQILTRQIVRFRRTLDDFLHDLSHGLFLLDCDFEGTFPKGNELEDHVEIFLTIKSLNLLFLS